MISTLPKGSAWGHLDACLQYKGFWIPSLFLPGILSAQQQLRAQSTDIILCSAPRTGTAWLKSLTFAIITRNSFDDSTTPLLSKMPHDLVPFMDLEVDRANFANNRALGNPLLAAHAPFSLLPTSIIDHGCKIVYICRDPKDTFVSLYHFNARHLNCGNIQPISLDEAFELFCAGESFYGPYWDHVLGYWKASLEHPDTILFLKYEEMSENSIFHLKKIPEFIGYPFSLEEQQKGVPERL